METQNKRILVIGASEEYVESRQSEGYSITYYPSIKIACEYFNDHLDELSSYQEICLENLPSVIYFSERNKEPKDTAKNIVYEEINRTNRKKIVETTDRIQTEGFYFNGYIHNEEQSQSADLPTHERIRPLFTEYKSISEGTKRIAQRIGLTSMRLEKENNFTTIDTIINNFDYNVIIGYDRRTNEYIEKADNIPDILRLPQEWIAQLSAANQASGIIATYKTVQKYRTHETKTEFYTIEITINYRLAINGMVSDIKALQFNILTTNDKEKGISYIDTNFEAIINAVLEIYLAAAKIPNIGLNIKSVEDYTKELNEAEERDKKTIYTLKRLRQEIKAHLNQLTKNQLNNLSIAEEKKKDNSNFVIKVQDKNGQQYTIIIPNKPKTDSITIKKDSGKSKTITTDPYDKETAYLTPEEFELLESIINQIKSKNPRSVKDITNELFEQTERFLHRQKINPQIIKNLQIEKAFFREPTQPTLYYITIKDDYISYRINLTRDSIKLLKMRSVNDGEDLPIENENDAGRLVINDLIESLEEKNEIGEKRIKDTLSPPSSIKVSVEEAQTAAYTIFSQVVTLLSRGGEKTYPLNNSMGEISINNHNIYITLKKYTTINNVMIPTTHKITIEIDDNIVAQSISIQTTANSVQLSKTISLDPKKRTCESLTTSDLALLESVSKKIYETQHQTNGAEKQLCYKMDSFYRKLHNSE